MLCICVVWVHGSKCLLAPEQPSCHMAPQHIYASEQSLWIQATWVSDASLPPGSTAGGSTGMRCRVQAPLLLKSWPDWFETIKGWRYHFVLTCGRSTMAQKHAMQLSFSFNFLWDLWRLFSLLCYSFGLILWKKKDEYKDIVQAQKKTNIQI